MDETQARRLQERSSRLYGKRNYPPEKASKAILDAVAENRAVVPVTPEARGAYLLSRFVPGALRNLPPMEPKL